MVMAEHSTGRPARKDGDSRHVHALFGLGHGAAQDDVFNFLRIKPRNARDRAIDSDSGQIVGTGGVQRPLKGFANGGANGTGDHGFFHDLAPASACVPPYHFCASAHSKGVKKTIFNN